MGILAIGRGSVKGNWKHNTWNDVIQHVFLPCQPSSKMPWPSFYLQAQIWRKKKTVLNIMTFRNPQQKHLLARPPFYREPQQSINSTQESRTSTSFLALHSLFVFFIISTVLTFKNTSFFQKSHLQIQLKYRTLLTLSKYVSLTHKLFYH